MPKERVIATVTQFAGNAAYTLWWPREYFAEELDVLRSFSIEFGGDKDWVEQVSLLLKQAFTSPVPAADFKNVVRNDTRFRNLPVDFNRGVRWVNDLFDAVRSQSLGPRPYFSQRHGTDETAAPLRLPEIAYEIRTLVEKFNRYGYFGATLGFECVGGDYGFVSTPPLELERLVNKSQLWECDTSTWDPADLFDFIEVFHDLATRPTKASFHSHCHDWHPEEFSHESGQKLYRLLVNQLLGQSTQEFRIAEAGEDIGRMVKPAPDDLGAIIEHALDKKSPAYGELSHAVASFRGRNSTVEDRRSAITTLAGVLERRRNVLKDELLKKDEQALFQIANKFNLRHRDVNQRSEYDPEFLDWIFYWYVATINLSDQLLAKRP